MAIIILITIKISPGFSGLLRASLRSGPRCTRAKPSISRRFSTIYINQQSKQQTINKHLYDPFPSVPPCNQKILRFPPCLRVTKTHSVFLRASVRPKNTPFLRATKNTPFPSVPPCDQKTLRFPPCLRATKKYSVPPCDQKHSVFLRASVQPKNTPFPSVQPIAFNHFSTFN